jgi:hypothetical protein
LTDALSERLFNALVVRGWAEQAGFASVQVMPVAHAFWRFYRLEG